MAKIHINENELKRLILSETMKVVSSEGERLNNVNEGLKQDRKNLAKQSSNVYSSSIDQLNDRELFNFAVSSGKGRRILKGNGIHNWSEYLEKISDVTIRDKVVSELKNLYTTAQEKITNKNGVLHQSAGERYNDLVASNNELQSQLEEKENELNTAIYWGDYYLGHCNSYWDQLEKIAAVFKIELGDELEKSVNTIIAKIKGLQTKVAQLTKTNQSLTTQIGQQQTQINQNNAQMYNDQVYAQQKAAALSDPSGIKAGQMLNNQVTPQS